MTKANDFAWNIRANACIANGALTNSKRPECFVKGVYDTHLVKARGPFVFDTTGKRLFDFICGLGSCILGHGNQLVAEYIYKQACDGITLSLGSTMEVILAEKIKEILPWIEKVRFLKTGSDACSASIKIARAKTNRDQILSDGYHGWHDEFVSLTPPAIGVLDHPDIIKFDNNLELIDESVAAVIIEPIITDLSPNRRKFLYDLREKCTEQGVMLIFDEVITGFRTPKFAMGSYLGIEPDLICMGKAMGNGMPISLVGGKASVMECGEYFVSSTFAGETCSIAAALCVIEQLQTSRYSMSDLWERGEYFLSRFNSIYPDKIRIIGYPTRGSFDGDPMVKALLFQESYIAGILLGSSFFFNFSHVPYIDQVLNILNDILVRIKTGQVQLKGEMPKSPFAQKMRENK